MVLLMLLFLSLVQIGLWAYTRALLTSAAADAARSAGLANPANPDTTKRIGQALGQGVTAGTRNSLRCNASTDQLMVAVHCTMTAPGIVGLLNGLMPDIAVTGHSAREDVR